MAVSSAAAVNNEGQIKGLDGRLLANYIRIFSTVCLVCREVIAGDGEVIALGDPYDGLVHIACYPKFSFSGRWPHACPEICYTAPACHPAT